MKRALIIGISGQDGAYLARELLEKGYTVIGTSRDHEASSFNNLIRLGIKDRIILKSMMNTDFRSVMNILTRYYPDEIYNLAGQTSVGLSFEYPVETLESILIGTMNLLECIRLLNAPIRLYNAGSGEVFGETETPANEKTLFKPRSPYGTAKAAATYAVSNYRDAYGLFACTGLLFNHESPLRPSRFVTKKIISTAVRIANGSKERLKLGNLDISRDWGWAPDYVDAMWRMLNVDKPEDYVIATGEKNTLKDFIKYTFSYLNLQWDDFTDSDNALLRPLDIKQSLGDPTKALTSLGWKSRVSFQEMIRLLINDSMNDKER